MSPELSGKELNAYYDSIALTSVAVRASIVSAQLYRSLTMTTSIAAFSDIEGWQQALYAFLAEKERRSGSMRTVESYSRMLTYFFRRAGKSPDEITAQDVFAYAHGKGQSGREPSAITIGARIACLSSFYRFLIRMDIVNGNPCDRLERPHTSPSLPRGLGAEQIRQLLDVISDTPMGIRDKAIILTLVLTGRRRTEVLSLKAGDIEVGETVYYTYRGKGGKRGRRELPLPAFDAIQMSLATFGRDLSEMEPGESLWFSSANGGKGITSGTFYGNLRKYLKAAGLPASGMHIFRHSAAKLRRDSGQTVEEVSRFLDHSSLAVTSVYLRRLEGDEDNGWQHVAQAIGL